MKFDADAIVLQGVRQRRDARKYIQYIDENEALCQNHIRKIKGSPQPPLHCITRVHCLEVSLLRASCKASRGFGLLPLTFFMTPALCIVTRIQLCHTLSPVGLFGLILTLVTVTRARLNSHSGKKSSSRISCMMHSHSTGAGSG